MCIFSVVISRPIAPSTWNRHSSNVACDNSCLIVSRSAVSLTWVLLALAVCGNDFYCSIPPIPMRSFPLLLYPFPFMAIFKIPVIYSKNHRTLKLVMYTVSRKKVYIVITLANNVRFQQNFGPTMQCLIANKLPDLSKICQRLQWLNKSVYYRQPGTHI